MSLSNVTKSVLTSFPFTVQAYKQIYFLCIFSLYCDPLYRSKWLCTLQLYL